MKILVVGTPRDVRGFALAGIEGRVVKGVEDSGRLRQALREASEKSSGVGLVLLSGELESLHRREQPRRHPHEERNGAKPAVVVLPGGAGG